LGTDGKEGDIVERLVTAGVVVAIALVIWIIGRVLKKRLPEQWGDLVGQLTPVLVLAVLVVGALVVIDPDQADELAESFIRSVPDLMVAVIIVIIARALGRIVGLLVEAALRGVSPTIAGRARLLTSSLIVGIGIIIALQQIGISTDIILVLVAAVAFGTALALALAAGLGSVPVARQVSAGRHVHRRYEPGDMVRIGEVEGSVTEIGLSTTRIRVSDHKSMDVPNAEFLEAAVSVQTDSAGS
jgi:small-conductance mechanosensitive channel